MTPLATQLRPQTLIDFIGQTHLVGAGKPVRQIIEGKPLFSMILWGPPGVGKTTLARMMASSQQRDFYELSAVSAGKNDIRQIIQQAEQKQQDLLNGGYQAPILFLDEIHRFNKAQQDYLLPFIESGALILIGATTENPSFEVIAPLLSRAQVLVLQKLTATELKQIINQALKKVGYKSKLAATTQEWLINYAAGDARRLLTILDHTLSLFDRLTLDNLKKTLQSKHLSYDKKGSAHYDTISAFIKSMRASQVDAALYYLARMVKAGEDPRFIARRMVIFASEDIGLAQPTALVVANAVLEAMAQIGYPEAQINLAHGVAYLCGAKKDRSAYEAYFKAVADVETHGDLEIPFKIRNPDTKLTAQLGYGKGYKSYDQESYLPDKIKGSKYF